MAIEETKLAVKPHAIMTGRQNLVKIWKLALHLSQLQEGGEGREGGREGEN